MSLVNQIAEFIARVYYLVSTRELRTLLTSGKKDVLNLKSFYNYQVYCLRQLFNFLANYIGLLSLQIISYLP